MLKTSFTTQLAENSLLHMAEDAKIDINGDWGETVKRWLSMSKNLNKATGYLNSDIRKAFT